MSALRVVARMSSPIAGDPPQLDGLLEDLVSRHMGGDRERPHRHRAAPAQGAVPIPIVRASVDGWSVARCSSPIMRCVSDRMEHLGKRFPTEDAALLEPSARGVLYRGMGAYRSQRLPIRTRTADSVAWLAFGDRREVLRLVRRVSSIGRKRAHGYGRVAEWSVESIDDDRSWVSDSPHGRMLMRPMPIGFARREGLVGWRPDFCAVAAPYWHSDRYAEAAVPC